MSKTAYYGKRTAEAVYKYFKQWGSLDDTADAHDYENDELNAAADEMAQTYETAREIAAEFRNLDEFVKLFDIRALIEEDAAVQAALDEAWSHESAETPFVQGVDYS